MSYRVRKVTEITKPDGTKETVSEHMGFVDSPENFTEYIGNHYMTQRYALTPPDMKSYGVGSKAIKIVDLDKLKCPIVDGAVFTIVSEHDKKLI